MRTTETTTSQTPTRSAFDRQLERVGWALFLIMIGALALVPAGVVPGGTWLVGTGLIMVGLNVVRSIKGVRVSGFTMVLGLIALALGISSMAGVDLPLLAILLVAVGIQIVYSAIFNKDDVK